jgi:hypothetical protein
MPVTALYVSYSSAYFTEMCEYRDVSGMYMLIFFLIRKECRQDLSPEATDTDGYRTMLEACGRFCNAIIARQIL